MQEKKKEKRKEKDNVFEACLCLCLDLYSRLTEHTFNSKDSTESVQMQIALFLIMQSVSLLRWFLYYSSYH